MFVLGVAHGGLVVDIPVIAKHVYGPRHMNRVLPTLAGFGTIGASSSPALLALSYDGTGGYTTGFLIFIALAVVAAMLMWRVRPVYRDRLAGESNARI